MKTIINSKGIETRIFAETFEFEAYNQIKKLVNFEPYLNSKVRIMPDAHAGKGCTVGTTMTITNHVTPNLVGVDINCGMLTVKLKNKEINFEKLDSVIRKYIPHGFDIHTKSQKKFDFSKLKCLKKVDVLRATYSIGTLGGGNHFIEVATSSDDDLYLIIHTGSRKLGTDVCKFHQDKAFQNVNEMSAVVENTIAKLKKEGKQNQIQNTIKTLKKPSADKDLATLTGTDFDDYINDMKIVSDYAKLNRETIAEIILKEANLQKESSFETVHNYIDFKRMILRKGAISAEKDEIVLIPMNMRDGSLLCKGKGNSEWNYSAPHGAGRLMSRSKAKENIDFVDFKNSMLNVFTTSVTQSTLDEAPQAYKPMQEIINLISETVEIIDILKPLYNFKSN